MTDLPRITFFVMAYNQEDTVRQAIDGAFSQSYPNLEILITDNCSTDQTFAIMQDMVARYDGPHTVVLNRNDANIGLVGHVNKVMELANGEFIIQNAGDDISYPNRAQRIVEEWLKSEKAAHLVFSSVERIKENGERLGIWEAQPTFSGTVDLADALERNLFALGAGAGWSRAVFDTFGPLGLHLYVEDVAISHRAIMLGPVIHILEPLVKWRVGGVSQLDGGKGPYFYHYGPRLKLLRWSREDRIQTAKDLSSIDYQDKQRCFQIIKRSLSQIEFSLSLSNSETWGHLALLPRSIWRSAKARRLTDLKANLRYLFYPIYKFFYDFRESHSEAKNRS